ncbi:MAG: ABC transporter ATP-binding protein [Chloroflexota bacterium]|nr:MAG: ABC transporter ATP-binding protein [Chloroflexota bacterium]
MVETRDLSRDYPMPGGIVHAVRDVSLRVGHGQLVALRGRSGSGKTTFLSMVGALDRPTRGSVAVDGLAVSELPESELVGFRRRQVGFIFQAFGLMPILSAAENVEVPLRLVLAEPRARDRRVLELLELVGLGGRANHRPHELSGGEQQRVAIARALANEPSLLLADEPTGQLDSQTGRGIMALLHRLVESEGMTAIVATHDTMLMDLADRVIELSDGQVVDDYRTVPETASALAAAVDGGPIDPA